MRLFALPALLSLLVFEASSAPTSSSSSSDKPLPVLLWHGLGDHFDNEGLHAVGDLINQIHPGTNVSYIHLGDSGSADRDASFYGDTNAQLASVCASLASDPSLPPPDPATGILRADALGFSQGGQLLRSLAQRCPSLRLRTLMTFGSQHAGIADVPPCRPWDLLCHAALALMRGNVWTDWVQSNIVPAQYFRSVDEQTGLPTRDYLDHSGLLADVNNEREAKNPEYARRVAALDMLVLFVFDADQTVVPPESGWFADVNRSSGEVTPLRATRMYAEDWLGLRALDEKDGLACMSTPGGHMQLDEGVLREAFGLYFGPETKAPRAARATVDGCGVKNTAWTATYREQEPIRRDL